MPAATHMPSAVPINGMQLRIKRQHCGFSGKELASRSGIHYTNISKLENGQRPFLSPANFRQLCDALGMTTQEEREEIVDRTVLRPERKKAA